MSKDTRTLAELKQHYDVEVSLADRLRHAGKAQRRTLYTELYDELFRLVPNHPQLLQKISEEDSAAHVHRQLRFLERFLTPETVFMELGAGDGALSIEVAKRVKTVYAIEISETIVSNAHWPKNAQLVISDGTSIPVPEGSVSLAYSNQLMEHLHPDDAEEQLVQIYRALAPGGRYICITPNRLNGPHDISGMFDQISRGFHLKEYTFRELEEIFLKAGFNKVIRYISGRSFYLQMPNMLAKWFEMFFGVLPFNVRRVVGNQIPCNAILALRLVAIK